MGKLGYQHGYVTEDVFDRHPNALTVGMVEGPYRSEAEAEYHALRQSSDRFFVKRIPGGPWTDIFGLSPAGGWERRWGKIPDPEGATVIPLWPID